MSELAIGVDIGGSHVACGIICDGCVIASETIAVVSPSLRELLPRLEASIQLLLTNCAPQVAALAGMAVGISCIVDRYGIIAASKRKYDDGRGFSFADWSAQKFGLRCVVENDARLALLGEHQAGAAKGFQDAVLISLGTGIGAAAMLDGKLLHSHGGRAGGLAGLCSCGNRGCAEAEASTARLDAICRGRAGFAASSLSSSSEPINFRLLYAAVDRDDALAKEVLQHCIGVWSALTVSLVHAYDPQVIIFGGGVMQRHETILPTISAYVARHAWTSGESVAILPASLGSLAALHGALALLRSR